MMKENLSISTMKTEAEKVIDETSDMMIEMIEEEAKDTIDMMIEMEVEV